MVQSRCVFFVNRFSHIYKCKHHIQSCCGGSVSRRAASAARGRWAGSRTGRQEGRGAPGTTSVLGRARHRRPGDHSPESGCETEGSSPETTPVCPEGGRGGRRVKHSSEHREDTVVFIICAARITTTSPPVQSHTS